MHSAQSTNQSGRVSEFIYNNLEDALGMRRETSFSILYQRHRGVLQFTRIRHGCEGNTGSNIMIYFSSYHNSNRCGLAQLRGEEEFTSGTVPRLGAFLYPENAPEVLRSAT